MWSSLKELSESRKSLEGKWIVSSISLSSVSKMVIDSLCYLKMGILLIVHVLRKLIIKSEGETGKGLLWWIVDYFPPEELEWEEPETRPLEDFAPKREKAKMWGGWKCPELRQYMHKRNMQYALGNMARIDYCIAITHCPFCQKGQCVIAVDLNGCYHYLTVFLAPQQPFVYHICPSPTLQASPCMERWTLP